VLTNYLLFLLTGNTTETNRLEIMMQCGLVEFYRPTLTTRSRILEDKLLTISV
jgi:hypothetical protein